MFDEAEDVLFFIVSRFICSLVFANRIPHYVSRTRRDNLPFSSLVISDLPEAGTSSVCLLDEMSA
jgi:amino acid permease